jgi:hypothetical protein
MMALELCSAFCFTPIRRAGLTLLSILLSLFDCWSSLVIHSPILPSCLDSFSFPSMCTGITFLLSVLISLLCLPSLTMSSPLIVVHISQSTQQVHPMPLDVLPSPLFFAFKKRGSSRMILRIIVLLIANVGAATTLKQDLCIIPMTPSY